MDYLQAVAAAQSELKAGHIRAYCTGYTPARGRYVEIQTGQGWCPEPFFQEFPDEEFPAELRRAYL